MKTTDFLIISAILASLPLHSVPSWGFPYLQTDDNWEYDQNRKCWNRVAGVLAGPELTMLNIDFKVQDDKVKRLEYWWSRDAYLMADETKLPFIGAWIGNRVRFLTDENDKPLHFGWDNPRNGTIYTASLFFVGKLPIHAKRIALVDNRSYYSKAVGFTASFNMQSAVQDVTKSYNPRFSEMELRRRFYNSNDHIEGIYETLGDRAWRIGCVKDVNGTYELIFLNNGKHFFWYEGMHKATLIPSATHGVFKANWVSEYYDEKSGILVVFDDASMLVRAFQNTLDDEQQEMLFVKMFPDREQNSIIQDKGEESCPVISNGSGFALRNGYLATNYHVVDDATDIKVYQIKNGVESCSKGSIVCFDKKLDIAILKTSFETPEPPYGISNDELSTGESIFALGYPLVSTMGKELKLTTGVISSSSGFQGDENCYQISAAVQPGNSGGPLFDERSGDVVGIVSAKHLGAENANYAIKSSRLRDFLSRNELTDAITEDPWGFLAGIGLPDLSPDKRFNPDASLSDKVSILKEYVYRIECKIGGHCEKDAYDAKNNEIWYPYVEKIYDGGVYGKWKGWGLVIIRIVLGENETMLEIGGKHLGTAWLDADTYLQTHYRYIKSDERFRLQRVEGLSNKKSQAGNGDDYVFRTFKAYFPPLPEGVTSIDFIEPVQNEHAFVIKGIHLK